MLFEALSESAERGELILVDGGLCRYHLRRDGHITITEIIVNPARRGHGVGSAMLQQLIELRPVSILARCPADLPSNEWYRRRGFVCESVEYSARGRAINVWRLPVCQPVLI